jgi:hypothetical protein
VLELDVAVLAAALTRDSAVWQGVSEMLERTSLRPAPQIVELRARSRAIAERAVAEAS